MKILIGPITLDIGLFLRLCLPATVFIGLCTGILLAFNPVLLLIDRIASHAWLWPLIGTAWLLLLILYIMLGIAFTHFVARRLRASFGSKEFRVQRRMALVSGLPFYAICLLCFAATLVCVLFPDTVNPLTAYISAAGFLGFALVSGGYLLLLRFLLGRSTTSIAY